MEQIDRAETHRTKGLFGRGRSDHAERAKVLAAKIIVTKFAADRPIVLESIFYAITQVIAGSKRAEIILLGYWGRKSNRMAGVGESNTADGVNQKTILGITGTRIDRPE